MGEVTSELTCVATDNSSLSDVCSGAFSQGLLYVHSLQQERNSHIDVLTDVACDVTVRTTLCLRSTLKECSENVQTILLQYYSLFTKDTCVAHPDQQIPHLRASARRAETVVVRCAQEAAQTVSRDQTDPQPTSLVDFVILGLKTDCKTFLDRYECYERELDNITNFMDFWLSLTFDKNNAVNSQKIYCAQIEERVIPQLTEKCFNQSQPSLSACETGFGREVEAIRREWFNNSDFDGFQLQTEACRTCVVRATCLGDTMRHCGENVARAMAVSELGSLPDICREILSPEGQDTLVNNNAGSHSGMSGDHRQPPPTRMNVQLGNNEENRSRESWTDRVSYGDGIRENKLHEEHENKLPEEHENKLPEEHENKLPEERENSPISNDKYNATNQPSGEKSISGNDHLKTTGPGKSGKENDVSASDSQSQNADDKGESNVSNTGIVFLLLFLVTII